MGRVEVQGPSLPQSLNLASQSAAPVSIKNALHHRIALLLKGERDLWGDGMLQMVQWQPAGTT